MITAGITSVGCVTCYAPIGQLEMVRNQLRTLRDILWVCEKREKDGL